MGLSQRRSKKTGGKKKKPRKGIGRLVGKESDQRLHHSRRRMKFLGRGRLWLEKRVLGGKRKKVTRKNGGNDRGRGVLISGYEDLGRMNRKSL